MFGNSDIDEKMRQIKATAVSINALEQDKQKCEAVLRSHPALNYENRSRMILDRFDPKSFVI